jgi:hypothetical protein
MNQARKSASQAPPFRLARPLAEAFGSADGVLEWLPMGVFACDPEGALTDYNRRAAEIWGRQPQLGSIEPELCAVPMV